MFWYNQELHHQNHIELAINEPAFLYGATVFTTLRIYHNSLDHPLTNWRSHCQRLQHSIQAFGWQEPDWDRLYDGAEAMQQFWPVLRLTIFPNGNELITGRLLPADLESRQQNGIIAWLADSAHFARAWAPHKTGNYLSAWLALQKAQKVGAQEAILIDHQGNWLETSTGNLWGWREGNWYTPPLDAGILPGLKRHQLITHLCQVHKQPVEEPWSTDLVKEFEALAYSNSVVEIIPIQTVVNGKTSLCYHPQHPSLQLLKQ